MSGLDNNKKYKIRNKYIEKVGLTPFKENKTKNHLRWFGHSHIRGPVRTVDQLKDTQIKRGKGKPRKNH